MTSRRSEKDEIFYDLAGKIMFGGLKTSMELNEYIEGKLEYRKGKDFLDVKKAIKKGLRNGMHKVEYEEDWIALYLKDVFKKVRKKNK